MADHRNPFLERYEEKLRLSNFHLRLAAMEAESGTDRDSPGGTPSWAQRAINPSTLPWKSIERDRLTEVPVTRKPGNSAASVLLRALQGSSGHHDDPVENVLEQMRQIQEMLEKMNVGRKDPPGTYKLRSPSITIPSNRL